MDQAVVSIMNDMFVLVSLENYVSRHFNINTQFRIHSLTRACRR